MIHFPSISSRTDVISKTKKKIKKRKEKVNVAITQAKPSYFVNYKDTTVRFLNVEMWHKFMYLYGTTKSS